MPTTIRQEVDGVRALLHDTGRGVSTAARVFDDRAIVNGFNDAVLRLFYLVSNPRGSAGDMNDWMPAALHTNTGARQSMPQPLHRATVTVNRLLATATATAATAAPDDLWFLEAGVKTTGDFVPIYGLYRSKPLIAAGHDALSLEGRTFIGTADTAVYWRKPTAYELPGNPELTEFPRSFYFAARLLAARELLLHEVADNQDRFKYYSTLLMEKVLTLK